MRDSVKKIAVMPDRYPLPPPLCHPDLRACNLCKEGILDKIDLEAFKDSLLGQDYEEE